MVHNTALNSSDNLPSYVQTITIAQMMSSGGEGDMHVKLRYYVNVSVNVSVNQCFFNVTKIAIAILKSTVA